MAYDLNQVSETFDVLTEKVKTELDIQWNNNRLKGTDYAEAYTTLMNTIIQVCVDTPVKDKQINKVDKDIENIDLNMEIANELREPNLNNLNKEIALKEEQKNLVERQRKGYDDNILFKLFDTQIQTWGGMLSAGALDADESMPDIIKNDEASNLYRDLKNSVGN